MNAIKINAIVFVKLINEELDEKGDNCYQNGAYKHNYHSLSSDVLRVLQVLPLHLIGLDGIKYFQTLIQEYGLCF